MPLRAETSAGIARAKDQKSSVPLTALASGSELDQLELELLALHPRDDTFPGEVLIGLAADALHETGVTRERPITVEGALKRFFPTWNSEDANTASSATPFIFRLCSNETSNPICSTR